MSGGQGELIDTKEIAELLGFNFKSAGNLCASGRLKSARKFGNAWAADKAEVLEYKRNMRSWSTRKKG